MRIKLVRDVKVPTRGTAVAAGLDFYVPNDHFEGGSHTIPPGGAVNIPTGVLVEIPKGHALIAFNKSGVAIRLGLQVGACVIDEDYQGELHIHLFNVSDKEVTVWNGDKLSQFVLIPVSYEGVEVVDELHTEATARGTGMAGSTGTR